MPSPMLRLAFWLWALSDFKSFPHQDFVKSLDPRYVSDMQYILRLYNFQKNNTGIQQTFEAMLAARPKSGANPAANGTPVPYT